MTTRMDADQESNVPLQNDGAPKSYSTMEKRSTGEILSVEGSNKVGSNNVGSNNVGSNDFDQTSPLKGGEVKTNQV
jgi:hypothetical protein